LLGWATRRIKTGDKVWARDTITGKNELQTVTAIAPQHRDQLVELRIAGEKSPLRTTPVHPIRARRDASAAAHWIKAGDLKAGDLLETGGWPLGRDPVGYPDPGPRRRLQFHCRQRS